MRGLGVSAFTSCFVPRSFPKYERALAWSLLFSLAKSSLISVCWLNELELAVARRSTLVNKIFHSAEEQGAGSINQRVCLLAEWWVSICFCASHSWFRRRALCCYQSLICPIILFTCAVNFRSFELWWFSHERCLGILALSKSFVLLRFPF